MKTAFNIVSWLDDKRNPLKDKYENNKTEFLRQFQEPMDSKAFQRQIGWF
jgi:hypothetical protein